MNTNTRLHPFFFLLVALACAPFALARPVTALPAARPVPTVDELEVLEGIDSQDRRASDHDRMRYFLIRRAAAEPPKEGYKLLLVLPGGDGSADFHTFVQRIHLNALDESYVVAQLVAPVWAEGQADVNVWPLAKNPYPGMEFTTEEFIAAVVEDVEQHVELDPNYLFAMAWSSSGSAVYSASLQDDSRLTGSFVAMSVFKPGMLPSLKKAKGHAYFLLHSPEDFIPIAMAEDAEKKLGKAKAEVKLVTYAGGHGWKGDVYGNMRAGVRFLEREHAKPAKKSRKPKGKGRR